MPVFLYPLHGRGETIVFHLVAEQNIHGSIEKVRHFHNEIKLRDGQLRFPFVYRSDRHAQHLGKLLLSELLLLSEGTNVFRKPYLHIVISFSLICMNYSIGLL